MLYCQHRGVSILNERIRKMRRALDLTQQEFADRLNIKRNTVATYETGKSNPSDAAVVLICREFNVSEEWLRTGKGEMFVELPRNEALAAQIQAFLQGGTDSFRERLVSLLLRLAPEQWDALEGYLIELMDAPAPAVDAKTKTTTQAEPDLAAKVASLERQNEEIQRQNQELAAKVAAMEEEDIALGLWDGSSASPSASAGSYNPSRSAKK